MVRVQRISDGMFVSEAEAGDGYRRLGFTRDIAKAKLFEETDALRLVNYDFFGNPLASAGYNRTAKDPQFRIVTEGGVNQEIERLRS